MCDYSLHRVATRPARVGDRLITSGFAHTVTRGFSAIGEPAVAVCLRPGTELAFEAEVEVETGLLRTLLSFFTKVDSGRIQHKVGRFTQIDMRDPNTHHDAIEFPDGRAILLTHLREGQRAMVLQLPADANRIAQVEHVSNESRRTPEQLNTSAGDPMGARQLTRDRD